MRGIESNATNVVVRLAFLNVGLVPVNVLRLLGPVREPCQIRSILMMLTRLRWSILLVALALCGCAGGQFDVLHMTNEANAAPSNYKAEILAFLRTYLNDPTKIRDAALTQPLLLRVGTEPRYVACIRFNAKNSSGKLCRCHYTAAVFNGGRARPLHRPDAECDGVRRGHSRAVARSVQDGGLSAVPGAANS